MAYDETVHDLKILDLAFWLKSSSEGRSAADVAREFGVSERNAKRRLRLLEGCYHYFDVETWIGDDRRKYYRVQDNHLQDMVNLNADNIAVLHRAADALAQLGNLADSNHLSALINRMNSLVPDKGRRRMEVDLEPLLASLGYASRPGARPMVSQQDLEKIRQALMEYRCLSLVYPSGGKDKKRLLQPHGLLYGNTIYLVATEQDDKSRVKKSFALDRMKDLAVSDTGFEQDEDFSINEWSRRSFGVWQDATEHDEIIWRFQPEAAANARRFSFHPDQEWIEHPDGSLDVRFFASGYAEMAWHLYQWGDAVEVIKPAALKDMVSGYQRPEFGDIQRKN